MSILDEIVGAMGDPQMRHAAVVHAPLVLSAVAALLTLALALTRGKNKTLRWSTLVSFAGLAVTAWLAASSGRAAQEELGAASIELRRLITQHEGLAEWIWLLGALGFTLTVLTWLPRRRLAAASLVAVVLTGGVTAVWTGLTGHYGGTAVYVYGAGTPAYREAAERFAEENEPHDPRVAFFLSEVKPILAANCMSCHGPDEFAASGLDMTTMRGILTGGEHGVAVVPGDAESSLVYQAASWTHETLRMPRNRERLPEEDIERIKLWIDQGAVWSKE